MQSLITSQQQDNHQCMYQTTFYIDPNICVCIKPLYRVSWSGRTTYKWDFLCFFFLQFFISLEFSRVNVFFFYLHQGIGSDIPKYIWNKQTHYKKQIYLVVHITPDILAIWRIRTTLSDNWNHLLWRGEAKQEPGKKFHSPNWGTLGHPPQTEEHYFTMYNYSTQFIHTNCPLNCQPTSFFFNILYTVFPTILNTTFKIKFYANFFHTFLMTTFPTMKQKNSFSTLFT